MRSKQAWKSGRMIASEPPTISASARPAAMCSIPSATALAPVAQAEVGE